MALTAAQIEQQKKQAEELLFSGPQTLGFAKGLFFGHFNAPLLFPYPDARPASRPRVGRRPWPRCAATATSTSTPPPSTATPTFPPEVVAGLGRLGVLGMTAPKEYGGRGFSQLAYTKIMEVIGGH